MKFLVSFLLIAILSFATCLYLPWWTIALIAFLVSTIIVQSPLKAFLAGFTAIFILWFVLSFWASNANGHQLAHRISMLVLKVDNPFLLMAVTSVIGGIIAGFASTAATWFRKPQKID